MSDDHLPGTLLADPTWLAARVADTGRRWDCSNARINGTLWWYSASSTLVAGPVTALLMTGRAPAPDLQGLRITLQNNGYLATIHSPTTVDDTDRYAQALIDACADIITPLAAVSGASPRALWAIASDSVANRALDAGNALGRIDDACALAATVCRPPLIPPRFVAPGPHVRRHTASLAADAPIIRRNSCCLIYQATDGDKCTSCPRQPRSARNRRPASI